MTEGYERGFLFDSYMLTYMKVCKGLLKLQDDYLNYLAKMTIFILKCLC
jgi:hypothetical protein